MCHQKKKGIFAPNYYKNFKCIANKCTHSCCVDWEIPIDGKAYAKYKRIKSIKDTVVKCEDGYCFKLNADGRCPHLNENGLCNIIIERGEAFLPQICQNHPRFFNQVADGVIEAGLGIVCEEALRLLLESETPFALKKIEEATLDEEEFQTFDGFSPLTEREKLFSIIENDASAFDEKINDLIKRYEIPQFYTLSEWINRLLHLEILDEEWKNTLKTVKDKTLTEKPDFSSGFDKYYSRLLLYFVYRHVSVAADAEELRARLGFSIAATKIIKYIFENSEELNLESLSKTARAFSAEIEYNEDNTFELIFEFSRRI